jgi:short-subunit dehydrogenase
MTKTALITGATSGIGKHTTAFSKNNYKIILCGETRRSLDDLKQELSKLTEVHFKL